MKPCGQHFLLGSVGTEKVLGALRFGYYETGIGPNILHLNIFPNTASDNIHILFLVLEARSMMTDLERNFQLSRQRGHCFPVLLPTVLTSNTDLIQMSFFG